MDFIERIFGMAPDGGSGSIEAAIVVAAAALIMTAFWVKRRAKGLAR